MIQRPRMPIRVSSRSSLVLWDLNSKCHSQNSEGKLRKRLVRRTRLRYTLARVCTPHQIRQQYVICRACASACGCTTDHLSLCQKSTKAFELSLELSGPKQVHPRSYIANEPTAATVIQARSNCPVLYSLCSQRIVTSSPASSWAVTALTAAMFPLGLADCVTV